MHWISVFSQVDIKPISQSKRKASNAKKWRSGESCSNVSCFLFCRCFGWQWSSDSYWWCYHCFWQDDERTPWRGHLLCYYCSGMKWVDMYSMNVLEYSLWISCYLIYFKVTNCVLFTVDILSNHPINIYQFQPLDEANLSDLKTALKGFLQKGETIKLETKVQFKCMNTELYKLSSSSM